MAGFRLGSKTKVDIEVNDKGETIRLDLGDPTFIARTQDMMREVKALEKKYKGIDDFLLKDDISEEDLLSDEGYNFGKSMKQYYKESRGVVDTFLGKGSCEKIFGDENYYVMFDDLFEQLQPYLNTAGEKFEKYISKTRKKYIVDKPNEPQKKVI
jgi:hypothetical protein